MTPIHQNFGLHPQNFQTSCCEIQWLILSLHLTGPVSSTRCPGLHPLSLATFVACLSRTWHSPGSPTSALRYKIVPQNGQAQNCFHHSLLLPPNLCTSWNFSSQEVESLFFPDTQDKTTAVVLTTSFFLKTTNSVPQEILWVPLSKSFSSSHIPARFGPQGPCTDSSFQLRLSSQISAG